MFPSTFCFSFFLASFKGLISSNCLFYWFIFIYFGTGFLLQLFKFVLSWISLKDLLIFSLRTSNHLHIVGAEDLLWFSYFEIFRTCYGRTAGLWQRHISLAVIVYLNWHVAIWVWGDYRSRRWFLGLFWLGGNFISWFLISFWIFRVCWLSVACFTYYLASVFTGNADWCWEAGLLANVACNWPEGVH